jgi:hypothetical protein
MASNKVITAQYGRAATAQLENPLVVVKSLG